MLRYLLWIVILFSCAVACVNAFSHLEGNVTLLWQRTLYTVSLQWLLVIFVFSLLAIYILSRLCCYVVRLPKRLIKTNQRHHRQHGIDSLQQLLLAFFEGRYDHSLELSDELLANSYISCLHPILLVIAAVAASETGQFKRRNSYLVKLSPKILSHSVFSYLLRAKEAVQKGDSVQFKACVDAIEQYQPHLTALLKLKLAHAIQTDDVDQLLAAASQLHKKGVLQEQEYQNYEKKAYMGKLALICSVKQLKHYSKHLPDSLKQNQELVNAIGKRYYALAHYQEAVDWALEHYPAHQNSYLLDLLDEALVHLSAKNYRKSVNRIENWLNTQADNASLLMFLGKTAYKNQLWGKARAYLESSITLKPSVAAWEILAKVYEEQGEQSKADQARTEAMTLWEMIENQNS